MIKSHINTSVERHLYTPGPKRILTLDGGGIRGLISLQILKRVESIIKSRHGSEVRLCDYFDLIVGTSTGAIIAGGLATGRSVDEIHQLYRNFGTSIFKNEFFRRGILRAKFDSQALREELKQQFSDITLGSDRINTGLAIILKRLDSGSPWIVYNAPTSKYYHARRGQKGTANKDILLRRLIRASTAAPTFFEPELIEIATNIKGAFVDGGVSPHNNPALQAFMLTTQAGYKLNWNTGADNLLLVSIGTGTSYSTPTAEEVCKTSAAGLGVQSLVSLMNDTSNLNESILQWISDSPTARNIDRVIGNLEQDQLAGQPLLTYLRYDAHLQSKWLRNELSLDYTDEQLESLECMANTENMAELANIGRRCANHVVQAKHFKRSFDLVAETADA